MSAVANYDADLGRAERARMLGRKLLRRQVLSSQAFTQARKGCCLRCLLMPLYCATKILMYDIASDLHHFCIMVHDERRRSLRAVKDLRGWQALVPSLRFLQNQPRHPLLAEAKGAREAASAHSPRVRTSRSTPPRLSVRVL